MPHIGDGRNPGPDSWRATFGSVEVLEQLEWTGTLWTAFLPVPEPAAYAGRTYRADLLQFRPEEARRWASEGQRPAGRPGRLYAVNAVDSETSRRQLLRLRGSGLAIASVTGYRVAGYTGSGGPVLSLLRPSRHEGVSFNGATMKVMGRISSVRAARRGGSLGKPWRSARDLARRAPCAEEMATWRRSTAAGAFDGQVYAIGDRIVYVGFDSYSGIGNALWYHGRPTTNGELFYNGTFAPRRRVLACRPSAGRCLSGLGLGAGWRWIDGFCFAAGDYAIFRRGGLGQDRLGREFSFVAAGAMILAGLPCVASASEWECAGQDLSVTPASASGDDLPPLSLRTRRAMDSIVCRSGSRCSMCRTSPPSWGR